MNAIERRETLSARVAELMQAGLPYETANSHALKENPELIGAVPRAAQFDNISSAAATGAAVPRDTLDGPGARKRALQRELEIEAHLRGLDLSKPGDYAKCLQSVRDARPELFPQVKVNRPAPDKQGAIVPNKYGTPIPPGRPAGVHAGPHIQKQVPS